MNKSGKKILLVLTSSATMGESDEPTGLWLEEFTVPYYALLDAGCEVTVASTANGEVPIDPRSLGRAAERVEENRLFHDDGAAREALTHSLALSEVDASEFDAIFLPGGHGTMWDLPKSNKLARNISALCAAGKPVAVVCHGPAGLVNATTPEGKPLVKGKRVSAFLTAGEEAVGLKGAVSFLTDERLSELGATLVRGEPLAVLRNGGGGRPPDHRPKPAVGDEGSRAARRGAPQL